VNRFSKVKKMLCTTLVLALPDFNKNFLLECDTSGKIIEVVLMQEECMLAFTNKKLCDRNLDKSTYEKEMLIILHTVDMWHAYLMGHHFHIKTNHRILKYFLE
jgi:hypothetical protein